MVKTNTELRIAYKAETADKYGGGNGGEEYAMNHLSFNGYQRCGMSEIKGTDTTGLTVATQYYFKVNVDGAGVVECNITTGAADVTYAAVIILMNAALIAAGTFAIVNGDLQCTSTATGASSTIALSAGTTGTDLFATLTKFSAFIAAVAGLAAGANGYALFMHLAKSVKLAAKQYKSNRIRGPGIALGKGLVHRAGVEFPEIEISYYLQGADAVFGALAIAGTAGAEGTSYTFDIVIPDPDESGSTENWTIFGAQLKSYNIEASLEGAPIITTTWICYDFVQNLYPIATGLTVDGTTAVQIWEDCSFEVDSTAITQMKSFGFKIINEYVDIGSGKNSSFAKFKPLLKDKRLEYGMVFLKEEGIIVDDLLLFALNDNTTVKLATGVETYTITNCFMTESNFPEYAGDDISEVEYSVKYENGNSVFARV